MFETRPLSLRGGDEIVFTRNLKKRKIINGERATVEEIGRERVRIRLESGRGLSLGIDDDDLRHIDHAWSSTVHRAQGMTKDNVIAILDALEHDERPGDALRGDEPGARRFVLLTDDTEQLVHASNRSTEGRLRPSRRRERELAGSGPGHACDREGTALPGAARLAAAGKAAREAGIPAFHMDGSDADGADQPEVRTGPEMPKVLKRALADHDPCRDRERVTAWPGGLTLRPARGPRLLAEALAANTDPRNLDGYTWLAGGTPTEP